MKLGEADIFFKAGVIKHPGEETEIGHGNHGNCF